MNQRRLKDSRSWFRFGSVSAKLRKKSFIISWKINTTNLECSLLFSVFKNIQKKWVKEVKKWASWVKKQTGGVSKEGRGKEKIKIKGFSCTIQRKDLEFQTWLSLG